MPPTDKLQKGHLVTDNDQNTSMLESSSEDNNKQETEKKPPIILDGLTGYVGFANLPNQVYRQAVKRGFEFTLMVVGGSGLGKSTLVNSLFLAEVYDAENPGPSVRAVPKRTVSVETTKVQLKENGVNLTLTIVDTPGFGDLVDNSNCWQPVLEYVENKYQEYLDAESQLARNPVIPDNRVHCCLYFVAPGYHGLRQLDVEVMRRLQNRVNIVPVISKADTLTPEECRHFKMQVLKELARQEIRIYEIPEAWDEEEGKLRKLLRDRIPFAVVGANTLVEHEGKWLRGRKYPWGVVQLESLEHNDFSALRDMLLRSHMQDLKDVTHNVHYENFRYRSLAQVEKEKREQTNKLKKMQMEMEQVLEIKVMEKRKMLQEMEAEMREKDEEMKRDLKNQEKELAQRRRQFELERLEWEQHDRKNKKKGFF